MSRKIEQRCLGYAGEEPCQPESHVGEGGQSVGDKPRKTRGLSPQEDKLERHGWFNIRMNIQVHLRNASKGLSSTGQGVLQKDVS